MADIKIFCGIEQTVKTKMKYMYSYLPSEAAMRCLNHVMLVIDTGGLWSMEVAHNQPVDCTELL